MPLNCILYGHTQTHALPYSIKPITCMLVCPWCIICITHLPPDLCRTAVSCQLLSASYPVSAADPQWWKALPQLRQVMVGWWLWPKKCLDDHPKLGLIQDLWNHKTKKNSLEPPLNNDTGGKAHLMWQALITHPADVTQLSLTWRARLKMPLQEDDVTQYLSQDSRPV